MNILIDRLPEQIKVGASIFQINTDFRAAVEFELLAEKGVDNTYKLIQPFFPDGWPRDLPGAIEAVLWFYRCGAEPKENEPKGKKPYSFATDSEIIFADFWRYYKLDLSSEPLHWWRFRALLAGLPEDSGYKMRCYYRTCDLKGLPKQEKERITKIRQAIEIKDEHKKITLEERNAQWLEYAKKRSAECQ